jgi:hypothetical protein
LGSKHVEAADPTESDVEQVTEHLRSDDTNPQARKRPRTQPDDQLVEFGYAYPRDIETLRDQRHELLDMSHLVGDGRRGEDALSAGQADVDHGRSIQREYQRRVSHDHHRATR